MKHYYLIALILFCFFQSKIASSQSLSAPCGSDYWREKTLQDPVFFQKNEDYERGILQVFQQKKEPSGLPENVKVLPTVIHIIHDGGIENITDAQAQQAITWLNQALANQGSFDQGSGTDCGIQLCLAQRTPAGLPTNGITRNQSPLTDMLMGTQDIPVKNLNRWNPKDYVNIWLVRSICTNATNCNVVGYTFFPYNHGSNIDGIVMEAGYATDINKIPGLAHELGHYLGLYHTFEGGCTNNNCLTQGDRICDTPPDKSTASVPCGQTVSTCSTDTQSGPFTTDQPDMTWNYMDYGIIACFHDFTPDQATRMNATVDGIRSSLLVSKGCLPPCPTPTIAGITPSATTIAPGETVNFSNTSQNASSYDWTLNGTSFGTQPNASYTFTIPGTYTVVLTAQSANTFLCDKDTASVVIQVVCNLTASFTVSNLSPEINDTISLNNTSQNVTQTEWFVNGVSQGSTLDSLVFSNSGTYEIKLVVQDGLCMATSIVEVVVKPFCEEENRLFQMSYKAPQNGWANGLGLTELNDGNFLFLLRTLGINGLISTNLAKMTPTGQQLWAKSLGQYQSDGGLAATSDGGFAIAFSVGSSPTYGAIAKFSSDGDLLWMHQSLQEGALYNLVATPDGKITACGSSLVQNEYRALFVQLDSDGNQLWVKEYSAVGSLGAFSIAGTPDGGFVATSRTGALFRLSPLGDMLWHSSYQDVFITDVLVLANGEIAACGANNAFTRGVFIKLAQNGFPILTKRYAFGSINAYFRKLIKDGDQGFILTTSFPSVGNGYLSGIDSLGNVRWTRKYPPQGGIFNALTAYKDNGIVIIGDRNDIGNSSAWVLKTDRKGRTGDCPSEPFPLTVVGTTIAASIASTYTETPPPLLTQPNISVLPWPVTPDTLCTFSCFVPNEICNNNLDDDGDGLFDCLDPECNCTEDKCDSKQANIWYFGKNAGLDFSTEPPTMLTNGNTNAFVASATQCDAEGGLLFYTDGISVFNRFHEVMPNGTINTWGGTYYCLIIPSSATSGQYYLAFETNSAEIKFFFVDMTLDNGKGDIAGSLITLPNHLGLAGTRICGSPDYWLLTHAKGPNSDFKALQFGPTVQNIVVSSDLTQPIYLISQLKISPDGHKVACAYFSDANFDSTALAIYDFNVQGIGKVSNVQVLENLSSPNRFYGVEFSPDGRFLYATGKFPGIAKLVQYDLEAGDLAAIKASRIVLATDLLQESTYPQLAPNGKIYLPNGNLSSTLDVIHQPNRLGTSCQYQAFAQNAASTSTGGRTGIALCSVISSYLASGPRITFPHDAPDTICSLNTNINYQIPNVQCDVDSFTWKIENLSATITSFSQNASIRFFSPGSGRLIVTAQTPCGTIADTLNILVVAPFNKTLNLGPDLSVCDNGVVTFNAGSGFTRYQWSDGTADSTTTTLLPGKYWVNVWDFCGNLQTDTINVSIAPNSVLDLGSDLPQQCSGFSVNYQRPANFANWNWSPADFLSCTDCPNVTLSPNISASWVVVAQTTDGCISVDTLNATIRDTLLFSRDTSVCIGQTLALFGAQLPADTTAEFFLPAPALGCDTLLTVNVLGIENAASEVMVSICPDLLFEYNGVFLPADTVAIFHFTSAVACDSVVTVRVNAYPSLTLNLPMDTTIRVGASVLLNAELAGTGTLNFAWTPTDGLSCFTCPDPLANPLDTITYTLSVTDMNGCTAQESVLIRVNEECRLRFPNAFTPNGDGSNDVFRPILDPCVRTVLLWKILNRWGQTVFEQVNFPAANPNLGWDGNWEGKPQPSDVLIWIAEFEYYDGRQESKSGQVSLIR